MMLVTGASGFVGRHMCRVLKLRDIPFKASTRKEGYFNDVDIATVAVGEIGEFTDWSVALEGCDTVFHLAARAHVIREESLDPWDSFLSVNVKGSIALARQAARSGVKRFVFMSSIGVLGNSSTHPFTNESAPAAVELYAKSKAMTENALRIICSDMGMELVIVRPPLVYGKEVPGNFLRLLQLLDTGIPLPFGSITALRSFVGIENLCDFLVECATHPLAAGKALLISDGEDISLPDMLRVLANEANLPLRIFPFPLALLEFAGRITGRNDVVYRLISSLQIDSSQSMNVLDWSPPISLKKGLRDVAIWFRENK